MEQGGNFMTSQTSSLQPSCWAYKRAGALLVSTAIPRLLCGAQEKRSRGFFLSPPPLSSSYPTGVAAPPARDVKILFLQKLQAPACLSRERRSASGWRRTSVVNIQVGLLFSCGGSIGEASPPFLSLWYAPRLASVSLGLDHPFPGGGEQA